MKKRERRRRFIIDECNHIYQRTVGGKILFYDREDFLVCYMIISVIARKYSIRMMELCFMVDHIHMLIQAASREQMADFMRDYSSIFIREYNTSIGRHGQMLHKSYGNAPKKGDKKMRSTIVYIGNNPVEKKLTRDAECYRWNFLRYFVDKNPFSMKVPAKAYSRALSESMKIVKRIAASESYLNYLMLRRMFSRLSGNEVELLTDYIIITYFPFDENGIVGFYNDWRQMIDAMHSTSGSEYDLDEKIYPGSDQIYREMIKYVRYELDIKPARTVTVLPVERKMDIARLLMLHTGASGYEVAKFLHLKFVDKQDASSVGVQRIE